jgi:hypothetical protein
VAEAVPRFSFLLLLSNFRLTTLKEMKIMFCLFVCLFACLLVCLFVCLFGLLVCFFVVFIYFTLDKVVCSGRKRV